MAPARRYAPSVSTKKTDRVVSQAAQSGGPGFEEAMAQVEALIARIESGEVGLEQALADYEAGVQLLKFCRAVLDRVEQRITDLTSQMQAEANETRP